MIKAAHVGGIVHQHTMSLGYCVSIGVFQVDKLKNWIKRNLSVSSYCWPEGESFQSFARCVSDAGLSQVGLNTGIFADIGAEKARRILNDYGLSVSTLNSAGYFTDPNLINQNMAVLDMAATLDATALCIITGGVMGGAPPANLNLEYQKTAPLDLAKIREKSLNLYNEFAHEAAKYNVLLGLEPITPFDIVTKGHVNSINAARHYLDMPKTNLIIDLFHSFWDPDLEECLTLNNTVCVLQFCDVIFGALNRPTNRATLPEYPSESHLPIGRYLRTMYHTAIESGIHRPVEFEVFRSDIVNQDVGHIIAALPGRVHQFILAEETIV